MRWVTALGNLGSTYEVYVETLVTLHRHCWASQDLAVRRAAPAPGPVAYAPHHEAAARRALEVHQRLVAEQNLSHQTMQIQELLMAVFKARQQDQIGWHQAITNQRVHYERWGRFCKIAEEVFADGLPSLAPQLSPFQPLLDLGAAVNVSHVETYLVRVSLSAHEGDTVPSEGLPKSKYLELYRDHIASAALRIARELFALLPASLEQVIVDVQDPRTILSVAFDRAKLESLSFDTLEPASTVTTFEHRMNLDLDSGFDEVAPLDLPSPRTTDTLRNVDSGSA